MDDPSRYRDPGTGPDRASVGGIPRWVKWLVITLAIVIVVIIAVMIVGGGHTPRMSH